MDRDTGRKGQWKHKVLRLEAGGPWKASLAFALPVLGITEYFKKSLAVKSDGHRVRPHSFTHSFLTKGYSVPGSDSDSGGTKGHIQSPAPA